MTKKNDIGLVKLKQSLEWTSKIKPACLFVDSRDLQSEDRLTMMGWGMTHLDGTLNVHWMSLKRLKK